MDLKTAVKLLNIETNKDILNKDRIDYLEVVLKDIYARKIATELLLKELSGIYRRDRDIDYNIIRQCIKDGADVNVTNEHRWTPLHLACHYGNNEAIKILLNCDGIKINAKDSNGNTPFWHFDTCKYPEITELLKNAGATKNGNNIREVYELGLSMIKNLF